jgi:uncharacterized paraquat-inducible protein A
MPLQEHLVELTTKRLIGCRECHATADVSINGSSVKLICPNCHASLGTWATTAEAAAGITAFLTNRGASQ